MLIRQENTWKNYSTVYDEIREDCRMDSLQDLGVVKCRWSNKTAIASFLKRRSGWNRVLVELVQNKESRTFVAKMAQYPELLPELHSAAVDQGLSIYTLVFGVADGGNGLKEALEAKFTNFQFILD